MPQELDLIPRCGVEGEGPAATCSQVQQCLAECEWLYGCVTVRLEVTVCAC